MEKARRSINNLMNDSPDTARLVENGGYREVAAETVQPGQVVAVKPGEKIPSDGIVSEGSSYINEATITGEPLPVSKGPEDRVYAGTLNTNGYLVIKVDRQYADTTLQRVIHLVMEAQSKKAPKQAFIDRFATIYTPAVIILAVLIAVLPTVFFNQPFSEWFYRALVLLVIACPCALVISTPVTVISGLTAAVRKGVLIKGGLFLENFSHLKAIAFDKTGTLTEGRPAVQDVIPLNGYAQEQLLTIAGSLEFLSPHPIAGAISEFTGQQSLPFKSVTNFQTIDGKGVEGKIDGEYYIAGNHRLFEEKGWCNEHIHRLLEKVEDERHTAVLVGNRQTVLGILSINDSLRPAAVKTVTGLKTAGLEKIVLLTGDNHRTAEKVAAAVGISDYRAELLPEDKLKCIFDLKEAYGPVAMVGDGVNDAPSLAASDIGIAMGTGSADAALDTADIVLMKDDLSKIHYLANLSRLTGRIIRQNIFFALALKLIFLILAIPGLATLWMAVIADMGASLVVIFNGLRTLR
jgi:Cd2+/Zn2+-exporting ATPase